MQTISSASSTLREAYDWLSERGLATLRLYLAQHCIELHVYRFGDHRDTYH